MIFFLFSEFLKNGLHRVTNRVMLYNGIDQANEVVYTAVVEQKEKKNNQIK